MARSLDHRIKRPRIAAGQWTPIYVGAPASPQRLDGKKPLNIVFKIKTLHNYFLQ